MSEQTRRTVLRGTAGTIVASFAGCLGSSDDEDSSTPDGSTETPTGNATPTPTPEPTPTPTPTPVPPSALDSDVRILFGDSTYGGNGVEVRVSEVGTPDAVKVYVRDDGGDVRWALLPEDDTDYSIYRTENGVLVESYDVGAGIETGGDAMTEDGVGWQAGTSPERTVEVYCVFDDEELLLEEARGQV